MPRQERMRSRSQAATEPHTLMKHASLALTGLLVLSAPALSQGYDPASLPAGIRWVAHLDVQALQKTVLFEEIRRAAGPDFEREFELDELGLELDINPLEDIKSVTVFGSTTSEEKAAVMLRTSSKIDAIIDRLQEEEDYRSFQIDGYRVHSWEGDEDALAYVHTPRRSEDRTVVISNDEDLLLSTVRVLDGRGRSLADARDPALRNKPSRGAFAFVDVAEGLSAFADVEQISSVAKMMRSFSLEVGENRGRFFLRGTLETRNGEDAQRIADIVNGAKALIPLLAGGFDELPMIVTDLIDGLQVSASGTYVTLEFSYDSRRLIDELKALEEEY